MKVKVKHLKINGTEVYVKYANDYTGKILPSYNGMLTENIESGESGMHSLYGENTDWLILEKLMSYNIWKRLDLPESGSGRDLEVYPGMIFYNTTTLSKKRFSQIVKISEEDLKELNCGESPRYWRNNFQFAYIGIEKTLKPYEGMLLQTVRPLESGEYESGWNIKKLHNIGESGIYQYKFESGDYESGIERPSYIGMIVANTCDDDIKEYYGPEESEWESLTTKAECGINQYRRKK